MTFDRFADYIETTCMSCHRERSAGQLQPTVALDLVCADREDCQRFIKRERGGKNGTPEPAEEAPPVARKVKKIRRTGVAHK